MSNVIQYNEIKSVIVKLKFNINNTSSYSFHSGEI